VGGIEKNASELNPHAIFSLPLRIEKEASLFYDQNSETATYV
jgi:hypothetical protein